MTCPELIKLSLVKARAAQIANKQKRIGKYNSNPTLCKECSVSIKYIKRKNKFCSHKCSAVFNNNLRGYYRSEEKSCKNCNETTYRKSNYCSKKCYLEHRRALKVHQIEDGLVSDRITLKNYLIEKFNYECVGCGIGEWLGKRLPLEIDHIDGNAGNNLPINLRLLCPNCHSITPTWKGKNKGSGRASRGLSLN